MSVTYDEVTARIGSISMMARGGFTAEARDELPYTIQFLRIERRKGILRWGTLAAKELARPKRESIYCM